MVPRRGCSGTERGGRWYSTWGTVVPSEGYGGPVRRVQVVQCEGYGGTVQGVCTVPIGPRAPYPGNGFVFANMVSLCGVHLVLSFTCCFWTSDSILCVSRGE